MLAASVGVGRFSNTRVVFVSFATLLIAIFATSSAWAADDVRDMCLRGVDLLKDHAIAKAVDSVFPQGCGGDRCRARTVAEGDPDSPCETDERHVRLCRAGGSCLDIEAGDPSTLALAIERAYEDQGYSLVRRGQSFSFAGDDDREVLSVEMFEGKISRVDVCLRPESNNTDASKQCGCQKSSVSARDIHRLTKHLSKPKKHSGDGGRRDVTNRTLQRALLLANDLPGVETRAVLLPAVEAPLQDRCAGAISTIVNKQENASNDGRIVVNINAERDRFDLASVIHNRGPESTGDWQLALIGGVNDAPYIGGRLEGLFAAGIEPGFIGDQLFGRVSWARVAHRSGTLVRVSGQMGASLPRVSDGLIEVESDTWRGRLDVEHPIIRSRKTNLYALGAFDVGEVQIDQAGIQRQERVSALEFGLRGELIGYLRGVTSGEVKVRRGFDIFGATSADDPLSLRGDGSPSFYTVYGRLQRYQPLFNRVGLLATVEGQYADSALFSLEEFGAGDATFGRGFEPVEIIGDNGYGASIEIDYSRDIPKAWLPDFIDGRFRAYTFFDHAGVANRNVGLSNTGSNPSSAQLSSVGVGAQVIWKERATLESEIAVPLTETPGTGEFADDAVHFFLTFRGFF